MRGQTAFRREAWLSARTLGLEVRGYQPTERDRQALARLDSHAEPRRQRLEEPELRLKIVESIVRNRIVEPARQDNILDAARQRLASWRERDPEPKARRERNRA